MGKTENVAQLEALIGNRIHRTGENSRGDISWTYNSIILINVTQDFILFECPELFEGKCTLGSEWIDGKWKAGVSAK